MIKLKKYIKIILFTSLIIYLPILITFFINGTFLFSRYSGILLVNILFCSLILLSFHFFKKIQIKQENQKNFLLLIGILYICFIVIELVLRMVPANCNYDETRYGNFVAHHKRDSFLKIERYRLWPHDHFLNCPGEFSYFRKINSENLSEKEISLKKNTNEIRIIGIGDSFTEGVGAPFDSTWVKQLEYKLNANSNNKYYSTINAGVIGSDPVFSYILLNDKLLKYQPDIVIFCINCSDISDIFSRGGFERFNTKGNYIKQKAVWWEWVYASLFCVRYVFDNILNFDFFAFKIKNEKTDQEVYNTIKQVINKLEQISLKKRFELAIVFHPTFEELLRKNYYADFIQLKDYINYFYPKIITIDLLNTFIQKFGINETNINNYYWKKDGHHNSRGYELFARGVEYKLKESGVLDSLMVK